MEKTITCGKKEGTGVVEYGILVETGLPDEKPVEIVEELTLEQVCERLGKNIKIIK